MKLLDRMQEWAAERFSFVQYPNLRPADRFTAEAGATFWKFQMPAGQRIALFFLGTTCIVLSLALLAAIAFVVYSFMS